MRKTVLCCSMVALCLTLFNVMAVAQDDSMHGPPKVLQIVREQVKPGKGDAHIASESAWSRALKAAKYDHPMLAMTSATGSTEAWFLNGYESFAALEKNSQKWDNDPAVRRVVEIYDPKEAEFVSNDTILTARYVPEASYHANVNIGEYRYFAVAIARFRLGADAVAFYKALNDAREKAGEDTHMAVYAVTSGAPFGTYISFTPMKSVADWDTPPSPALQAAEKETGWIDMIPKDVAGGEFRLFAFSAGMSIPSKEMIAAAPDFWSPKPMMAKKAKPAGEVMPAAKKEMKK
ncbi:MAG: hypothetical protein ACRD3E_20910 [Terriglobales bacterium]